MWMITRCNEYHTVEDEGPRWTKVGSGERREDIHFVEYRNLYSCEVVGILYPGVLGLSFKSTGATGAVSRASRVKRICHVSGILCRYPSWV